MHRRRHTHLLLAAAVGLTSLTTTAAASAFCGFYVSGADNKLFADATQVVLMRDGTKTVLSMQNDYKGPTEKFALVIPVPVVLQKENVKVLPREVFDKVDKLGAPRLVEYWEQDPCGTDMIGLLNQGAGGSGIGLGSIGTLGHGAGDLGVKVEARFAVGEYEIVVLSAKDAAGLETWLKQEKYAIPAGAEPYFKPYVASGTKFFVAKVDPTKVKFEDGRATLSPLRFHYDSDKLTLPMRLGLINSSGKQDLIVNVLSKGKRYEAANYPNVTIPTNLDLAEAARDKFGEFYVSLFDKVVEKTPKAVVTEYSWDAGTCDPCPGPTLDGDDLATLGADVLPQGTAGLRSRPLGPSTVPTIRFATPTVRGRLPPEVIQRIVRQNFGRLRLCYENAARSNPKLAGKVEVKFTIDASGAVSKVAEGASDLPDAGARQCVTRTFSGLSFPQPDGGSVDVTYPVTFGPPDPNAPAPVPPMGFGGSATPYVLTRLHLRYDKDSLGEDLALKEAPPITGGREVMGQGGLEKGATPGATNNFQGRYAIRHPWTGPVTCKEPVRGRWGGPPAGTSTPTPTAAQKTAFVARGAALGTFVKASVPELDVKANNPSTDSSSAPAATDAGDPSASADGGAAAKPAPKGGCSTAPGSHRGAGALTLAALLGCVAAARRARSRGC
jgi:hypothetical protein